ncbi:MAG: hypothetical protein JW745_02560 [Sedimentisphaerales bacterium]|nr:hypothetical protein [Sedimentisphaerales bacterium]MBN2843695.1 hypothetical protein [Sedimentisphaerales bacterium]
MLRKRKKKRILLLSILLGIAGAVFIALCAGVTMYLLAIYKPAEYAPEPIPVEQQEMAVDQAIALIADIHNNVYASNTFAETIDSSLINRLLLHNDLSKIIEREFANREYSIRHPQISIRNGKLIFYVSMTYARQQTIVSITITPELTDNGQLSLELTSVRSGLLGLPSLAINDYLITAADKIKAHLDTAKTTDHGPNKEKVEKDLGRVIGQVLPELLRKGKVELDPVINSQEDKKIRISDIKLEDQQAIITFSSI